MSPPGRGIATIFAIALVVSAAGTLLLRSAPLNALAPAPEPRPAAPPTAPTTPPPPKAPAPPPEPTYELAGMVQLLEKGKLSEDKSLLPRNTVVLFEPTRKVSPARAVNAEMSTLKKEFNPRLLVVPVGSAVRFTNFDPILHNAFSISGKNSFDLGLAGKGQGKSVTFHEAGIVRVFCNVHHGMFAYVFVAGSPFWATPGDDGRFRLAGLPAGPGKLTVWNERSAPQTSEVTLPARQPLTLGVEITMPRIPPHKNKLGRPYGGGNRYG